ncbi:hypothetical protein C5023_000229 [Staphylococcus phage vB_SauM_0414_108]|nr:hypothetical protein C5023_000005 [Staphylococcus phage vB_SauM_0414_108]AVX47583.1 hypothetical protein C5023_000229 [Staphylococcus phage vB_SauM_0414_108]WPH67135.1 hypothetical protein CUBB_gp219 [Staphylococcus phage CUB-B]
MIIIYFHGKSKSSLSTVLNFINNNSSRDFTYDIPRGIINEKVDVNIITQEYIDRYDVQELSRLTDNDTICMSVSPSIVSQYRSGQYISVSDFEEYVKEM